MKSWPRNNGEAVDDLDEVLKHLLTWPDIKHLFKLCGTSVGVLGTPATSAVSARPPGWGADCLTRYSISMC